MSRTGSIGGPFTDMLDLLAALAWESIEQHPESPIIGDVIMYKDGGVAFVGSAAQVSYGSRADMQTVARLFPRRAVAAAEVAENPQRHDDVPVTHDVTVDEERTTHEVLNFEPRNDDTPALLKER